MRHITLLSLIFSAIYSYSPHLYADTCTYDDDTDSELSDKMSTCNATSGKEWSCSLNRCLKAEEMTALRHAYQECEEDTDATESEKKECYDAAAISAIQSDHEDINLTYDYSSKRPTQIVFATSLALATIMVAGKMKEKSDVQSCLSNNIFTIASVAGIAGEVYNYYALKDKVKDIEEDYKKTTLPEGGYDAQHAAFKYLKEIHDEVANTAERKRLVYYIVAGLYGVAATVAALELTGILAKKCTVSSAWNTENRIAQVSMPTSLTSFLLPSAIAKDSTTTDTTDDDNTTTTDPNITKVNTDVGTSNELMYLALFGIGGGVVGSFLIPDGIKKAITSSAGIAIVSGVAAILSFKLAKDHNDIKDQAKNNAKLIESTMSGFTETMSSFCSEGRDDLSVPRCYCYTAENVKDTSKTNSTTCQNYWAQRDKNYYVEATDYSGNSSSTSNKGCLTMTQQFDANCDCRKFTMKDGSNACYKTMIPVNSFKGSGVGTAVTTLTDAANKVTSGELGTAGSIDANAVTNAANAFRKSADTNLEKFNEKAKEKLKINGSVANKMVASLATPQLKSVSNKNGMLSGMSTSLSGEKLKDIQKAIKSTGIKIGKEGLFYDEKTVGGKKKDKEDSVDMSFLDGSSSKSKNKSEIDFMNQKYKYKAEDINDSKDKSIWEILSDRYIKTGLKFLFNDEK